MKMIKKLLFSATVFLILIGGFMFIKNLFLANKRFEKPLIRFTYTSGGGMDGSYTNKSVTLDYDKAIIYCHLQYLSITPTTKEYFVDKEILNEIEEIFYKYKMSSDFNKLKLSNIIVYDAPTSSYSFNFDNLDFVNFNSSQAIPNRGYKAIDEIFQLINSYCIDDNKIPGLTNEARELEIEDNQRALIIYDYGLKKLTFYILNESESIDYDYSYELYYENELLSTDKDNPIELQRKEFITINKHGEEKFIIPLNDYLKAGHYRLVAGNMSADFEIN